MATVEELKKIALGNARRAHSEGDEEDAAKWRRRYETLDKEGSAYSEKDEGVLSNVAVGAGRGATDLAQGSEQTARMTGDTMSGAPIPLPGGGVLQMPTGADAFTEEMNAELEQYNESFPEMGAQTVGRVAGVAAPAIAALPFAGITGAAATGAIEGLLTPTTEADWGDKLANSLLGGGVGFAGAAVPAYLPGKLGGILPRSSGEGSQQTIDYAVKHGLPVNPRMVSASNLVDLGDKLAETQLGDAGNSPAIKAYQEVREILTDWKDEAIGDAQMSDAVSRRWQAINRLDAQNYNKAWETAGRPAIARTGFMDALNTAAETVYKTPGGKQKVADIKELVRIMPHRGSAQDWHDWISKVGETQKHWSSADKNWSTKPLQDLYWNLRNNLNDTLTQRNPEAGALLKKADEQHRMMKQIKDVADLRGLETEEVMKTVRGAPSVDHATKMIHQMSKKDRKMLVGGILDDVIQAGTKSPGDLALNPGAMISALDRYGHAIGGLKSKGLTEQAQMLEGLKVYLNSLNKMSMRNPELFNSVAGALLTKGATIFQPRTLMKDSAVRRMLRRIAAGDAEQQVRMIRSLNQKVAGGTAGAAASTALMEEERTAPVGRRIDALGERLGGLW